VGSRLLIAIQTRGYLQRLGTVLQTGCRRPWRPAQAELPLQACSAVGGAWCLEKVRVSTPRPPRCARLRMPWPLELEESPWFSREVVSPPACSCSSSRSPHVSAPAGSPHSTLPGARTFATTPSPSPRAPPPARLHCQFQLCQGANSSTGCFTLAFLGLPCPQLHLKPTHPRHHSPVGCGDGMRNAGGVGWRALRRTHAVALHQGGGRPSRMNLASIMPNTMCARESERKVGERIAAGNRVTPAKAGQHRDYQQADGRGHSPDDQDQMCRMKVTMNLQARPWHQRRPALPAEDEGHEPDRPQLPHPQLPASERRERNFVLLSIR
jgi:hypothetical protein